MPETPHLPQLPPEDDQTRRSVPTAAETRAVTRQASYYVPPASATRQVPRRSRQKNEALRLPLWSLFVMLLVVIGLSFSIVLLILNVGGSLAPTSQPRFVVITAQATAIPSNNQPLLITPTILVQLPNNAPLPENLPQFALQGPTLEPVPITPTEVPITVGTAVIVSDADSGLNIRSGPGIFNDVLFVAPEGQLFTVINGPVQESGLTWWQVQDPTDPNQIGWAAAIFLNVQSVQEP